MLQRQRNNVPTPLFTYRSPERVPRLCAAHCRWSRRVSREGEASLHPAATMRPPYLLLAVIATMHQGANIRYI